jgi:hypothetical protein
LTDRANAKQIDICSFYIEPSIAIPDDIQPYESGAQVLTDSFDNSSLVGRLELGPLYRKERKPRNKRSELWDEFHIVDLETEYRIIWQTVPWSYNPFLPLLIRREMVLYVSMV